MKARFPWKIFSRIISIQVILLLVALAASGIAARYFFKKQFITQIESQLRVTLVSLSKSLPTAASQTSWCSTYSADTSFRLTLIAQDGSVLCDSHHDPQTMENHASRPEVLDARKAGFGESVRFSATINEDMLYGALWLQERNLTLRGAIPLNTLARTLHVLDTSLALFLFLVALVLGGFAVWSGQKLALPIGRLLMKAQNTTHVQHELEGIDQEAYGELSELETSLDDMKRDLLTKAESLNQEREEQATLMSAISGAALAVDLEGVPLFYNSRFIVLLGREELRNGKPRLWEMFREPEILDAYQGALKEGKSHEINALALGEGPAKKYFSISVASLRRSDGVIYGAVGIFHDVTDLKRAEQVRIDFVANVSHELRTPLTAIKGYSDTLRDDLASGKPITKEFVEIINRNTSRLMNLINDLLDLSSLESGSDDLQKTDLNTQEVSARIVKQLERTFQTKKQEVNVDARVKSVFADPRKLEQVLVNLLDNASKYTPSQGKISVQWVPGEASTLLKIVDTGPGIPPEHHTRLFERFYRVDKARSRELGGTGLGLAIVKHIMQRHSGNVLVESTVGEGATFICKFPNEQG